MVKDWLEVSRTGFDALFDSSLAELAYLRYETFSFIEIFHMSLSVNAFCE